MEFLLGDLFTLVFLCGLLALVFLSLFLNLVLLVALFPLVFLYLFLTLVFLGFLRVLINNAVFDPSLNALEFVEQHSECQSLIQACFGEVEKLGFVEDSTSNQLKNAPFLEVLLLFLLLFLSVFLQFKKLYIVDPEVFDRW